MSSDKSRGDPELGVARCSLEGLLNRGADPKLSAFPVKDKSGATIGHVTCSVDALAAMRSIAAEFDGWLLPQKAPKRASHGEVKMTDVLQIELGNVTLRGRMARKPPAYVNATLELSNAPGVNTASVPMQAGSASFDLAFSKSFEAPIESAFRDQLFKSLESNNPDETKVNVTINGAESPSDKSGSFLGNGSFSLHDLLEKKKEFKEHQAYLIKPDVSLHAWNAAQLRAQFACSSRFLMPLPSAR